MGLMFAKRRRGISRPNIFSFYLNLLPTSRLIMLHMFLRGKWFVKCQDDPTHYEVNVSIRFQSIRSCNNFFFISIEKFH